MVNTTYLVSEAMDAHINGDPISLDHGSGVFITAQWSAGTTAPDGTLKLQGSVDGTNWEDIADAEFAANPDGTGAGTAGANFYSIFARWVRLRFERNAGSADATLSAQVCVR